MIEKQQEEVTSFLSSGVKRGQQKVESIELDFGRKFSTRSCFRWSSLNAAELTNDPFLSYEQDHDRLQGCQIAHANTALCPNCSINIDPTAATCSSRPHRVAIPHGLQIHSLSSSCHLRRRQSDPSAWSYACSIISCNQAMSDLRKRDHPSSQMGQELERDQDLLG